MNLHLAWLLWSYGGDVAAFLCCIWAFWKGGSTERYGAAIIATGWILTGIVTSRNGGAPGDLVTIIDVAGLIGFAALAIVSRRIWAIVAAACMVNSVASHFTAHVSHFGIYSYVTAIGFWGGWGLVICLAAGVWGHIQRQKKIAPTSST